MSQSKPQLKLDWCSHDAASYAVEHWHYSQRMPVGKMVKIGVWENAAFIGCVLFSRGANNNMLKPYGLEQTEGCELTRVALTEHQTPVSRILAISIKMLIRLCPGLRLLVSFADPVHDHVGSIYQASNWLYVGMSHPDIEYLYQGKQMHRRSVLAKWGTSVGIPGLSQVRVPSKHRYVFPLDSAMKQSLLPLSKPYPKKSCVTDVTGNISVLQAENRGSNPTVTLHSSHAEEVMHG